MLYTLAATLTALWLFGLAASYTMSGFVHVLLITAVALVLTHVISSRKTVKTIESERAGDMPERRLNP